jgi:hypothetical protein
MSNNTTTLRADVIEHAMRLGAGEAMVLSLVASVPQSAQAFATIGRLMELPGVELATRSPLVVWCTGDTLDPAWRERCHATAGLWTELGDLRTMFGEASATDTYAELQVLRERADASLEH